MSCEKYQSNIIAYSLGELTSSQVAELNDHLDTCDECRATYQAYGHLIAEIEHQPAVAPTISESAALSRALDAALQPQKPAAQPLPQGLPALIWASVAAFVVVSSLLFMQVWGCLSVAQVARTIGFAPIALALIVTVFVTSFLPIAVAAKRKPLNGMTFRR